MGELAPLRRNRDFLLLQAGQLLSMVGSTMSGIAYPLLAFAVTGSAGVTGAVSAARLVPMLGLSLVAGLAADRFDRRRLMIGSDVLAGVSLAVLAAAAVAGAARWWLIVLVAFVDSACAVFFRAGQSGAFRAVVPLPQVAAASSVVQARLSAARLTAPPLGGALFAVARPLPFLADALSYAASTVTLLLMRTPFQQQRQQDPAPLRRQFAEGLQCVLGIPFLRVTLLMVAVSNFTASGMELAIILLAATAKLPGAVIGAFVALSGASTLLGALVSPLLRRWLPMRVILLLEYWSAAGYVAFLIWPNVVVLAVAFAAQAFCFPNTDSAVSAYFYALVPDRLIGRAMSVSGTLRTLAAPLGPPAAALLLTSASPRIAVATLAGVTVAAAVLGTVSAAMRQAPPLGELIDGGSPQPA